MASVRESFDDFMRDLELTQAEQENASRQQNDLRDRLRQQLRGLTRDVLVGSYARRTAVRPLNDIDLFLELDPVHWAHRRETLPLLLLEDLQRALRACYPGTPPETRIQGRSVNIEFSGSGIGYDVIPAFRVSRPWQSQEIYKIPDRNQERWISTNAEGHRQRCVAANERAGGMLNRLIKAAKHWNRGVEAATGEKVMRSFHLEVLAYGAFRAKPPDERRGLVALFVHLRDNVSGACPDPEGLGPDVDAGMSRQARRRAHGLLTDAAVAASTAVALEEALDDASACRTWAQVLGAPFRC